jgi:hypothetical protein
VPAAGEFGRLTVKYSSRSEEFCAVSVANVSVTTDEDGKPEEKAQELVADIMVPKTMLDSINNLEHLKAPPRKLPDY